MISSFCKLNPFKKTLPGHINQLLCLRRNLADPVGSCRIGMLPLIDYPCIQADNIAFLQIMMLVGNSVDHLIIY